MTINIKSGYDALFTGVQAYLTAKGQTGITVASGFKERAKQINQGSGGANRIVFIPGDPKSGKGGQYDAIRGPGLRPVYAASDVTQVAPVGYVRAIVDRARTIFVSVWSYDATAAENEHAQLIANDSLTQWAERAIAAVGLANLEWVNFAYSLPGIRSFGLETLIQLRLQEPSFDVPIDTAYPAGPPVVSKGTVST